MHILSRIIAANIVILPFVLHTSEPFTEKQTKPRMVLLAATCGNGERAGENVSPCDSHELTTQERDALQDLEAGYDILCLRTAEFTYGDGIGLPSDIRKIVFDYARDMHRSKVLTQWSFFNEESNDIAMGTDDQGKTIIVEPITSLLEYNYLKFWDTSGNCTYINTQHAKRISGIAIGKNDKSKTVIASGSLDGTIKLWNASGKCTHTLRSPYSISSIAMGKNDSNKTIIISGSFDNTIKLWDTSGHHIKTLYGHTDRVLSVAIGKDEYRSIIVSGSKDDTVKLWDTFGNCICTLKPYRNPKSIGKLGVTDARIGKDRNGKTIIVSVLDSGQVVQTWDMLGNCIQTLTHDCWYKDVAIGTDDTGAMIIALTDNNTIFVCDPTSGKCIETLNDDEPKKIAISKDNTGKTVIISSDPGKESKTLTLWSYGPGIFEQTLKEHEDTSCSTCCIM